MLEKHLVIVFPTISRLWSTIGYVYLQISSKPTRNSFKNFNIHILFNEQKSSKSSQSKGIK